ncbi:MAG: Na+/H+ antiporter subunit E [Firmicutes bacterium]|nr:Na+/H+ antiporter subunit E [Bacillota bacterium]
MKTIILQDDSEHNLLYSLFRPLAWSTSCLLFWLALAWAFDWQHVLSGLVVILFLLIMWQRFVPKVILDPSIPLVAVQYGLLLAWEVVKANIHVALIVLNPTLKISPAFTRVAVPDLTPKLLTVLANSITLTPGTLTVDIEKDTFLLHILTQEPAFSLEKWSLTRLLLRLRRRCQS